MQTRKPRGTLTIADVNRQSFQTEVKARKNTVSNIVTESDLGRSIISDAIREDANIIFEPNPGPQTDFLAATEKEVFYGGARGGGKSYSLLVDPLRYAHKQSHRALILRRTMPELRDLINHSHRMYDKAFPGAKWNEQAKEWRFPSGARIEFGYAETLQDSLRYQGQSYTWIGIDELPQFPTPDIWNELRGSLRSVDPSIPEFMRATGNPGNVGSLWVKEMFIDPAPAGQPFEIRVKNRNTGEVKAFTRRFIPAKLADNPYLTKTDSYELMLLSLPEHKRKQWLEGDWTVFEGAAFPEFDQSLHVCEPFSIPSNWPKFRACDWGYSSPFCVLWFAVDYDNVLYVYREFYGKGLSADVFAQRVKQLEYGETIQYGKLDSSVWSKRGDVGPPIPEIMGQYGCHWQPSDRSPGSRHSGKFEVHRRLRPYEQDGQVRTKLKIFNTCRNLIRTLPMLPLDENDLEDVDTKAEDHAYDALRYGVMSRPIDPIRHEYRKEIERSNYYSPANKKVGY